ncbi:MAG: ATP-binding protein [Thiopseudomonas sp.]|nr:ATP-binding protein [Thiopseudomonas sp.]MCK9466685.1 ATP-binding protein [Thiopseudomonas sp.]
MRTSLRWRLFALLAVSVLLAWIATAFFTYLDTRHEIGSMLDKRLMHTAELVLQQVELGSNTIPYTQPLSDYTHTTLQVWQHDGTLLMQSTTASTERLGTQHEGLNNAVLQGIRYRTYSLWDAQQQFNVRVAERYDLRDALAESVARHLLHPLYFAVPGLGVLIWLAVGAGLAPLSRFANEVKQRQPDKLDPLELSNTPREVLPLQNALNSLFKRLQDSLEYERRFTADAAHELRTPLAAIKTQAQVACAATDADQRQHSLSKVILGADRAAHLIDQLLVLAQLDPEHSLIQPQQVQLAALVSESIAQHAPAAIRKTVELGFTAEDDGLIQGDSTLLAILVRNLIDNAVRYTPSEGQVDILLQRHDAAIVLQIADTGPGIATAELQRITSRFYRVLGSGEDGSGLGLSIVERIAKLHAAQLSFDTPAHGTGLVVRVRFKAAT